MTLVKAVLLIFVGLNPPQTWAELRMQSTVDCLKGVKPAEMEKRQRALNDIINIEKKFFATDSNTQAALKGMLLAAACEETQFDFNLKTVWALTKTSRKQFCMVKKKRTHCYPQKLIYLNRLNKWLENIHKERLGKIFGPDA